MKRTNLRDIIISFFLISTLGVATFIVSCSDQDNIISTFTDNSGVYQQHVHNGFVTSAISATFGSIGEGAGNQVGSLGIGWVLGAMGLTATSPNWQGEFNTINGDLNHLDTLLGEADAELSSINNVLTSIDSLLQVKECENAQTSLQDDIGAIINQYSAYNSILSTSAKGDTNGLYSASATFVDYVLNGIPGGQVPITTALVTFRQILVLPVQAYYNLACPRCQNRLTEHSKGIHFII